MHGLLNHTQIFLLEMYILASNEIPSLADPLTTQTISQLVICSGNSCN